MKMKKMGEGEIRNEEWKFLNKENNGENEEMKVNRFRKTMRRMETKVRKLWRGWRLIMMTIKKMIWNRDWKWRKKKGRLGNE